MKSEQAIIDARIGHRAAEELSPQEFDAALTGIIFNVSVICGCQLPTHDAHINALEKEFLIFLRDNGYTKLTVEEILLAFRMNANFQLEQKTETYGSVFNIDFAAKILRQYAIHRKVLDQKAVDFFNRRDFELQLEREAQARRVRAKEQFEKYLADDNAELNLTDVYMQLADDGAFSNNSDYFTFYKNEQPGEVHVSNFMEMNFEKELAAKKRLVKFLFKNMKLTGRTVLYDQYWKLVNPNFQIPKQIHGLAD